MGRAKHEQYWIHVTKVENGRKWICKHCNRKFSGGASRIETHLGGKGGGIGRCSIYRGNEGVHNNMASSSSNPPEAVDRVCSTQDRGVNEGSYNRSVFESEINHLKQLVIDLEREENDVTEQLQSLESRGKKRKPEIDVWLEELQAIKESVDDMNNLNDIHVINRLINGMKQHKQDKPLTLTTEFVGQTLDKNIKKVLELLKNDQVFVIGIYGMGGVGKTLLATLVENEVKRKTTFKDVFWVTVSRNFNISKLQHDIAKRIGVKLDEDDEKIRADNLSLALEKKEKSVLILDDVWKYIDLQKVGIHTKVNGIKVILTTRLKHVCQEMDCQPYDMIEMHVLSCFKDCDDTYEGDEDWELFMLKLGHDGTPRTLPHEIEKIAKCMVERFWGLQLGIIVMARTMKGINDIREWKHALNKLKKLEMGQEVVEEVLMVLKCSYDNLMEKELQNWFLFCALLDSDFELFNNDVLIMKLVDNGLINGNRSLEEIFDEGNAILDKFKAHSLKYTHPLVKVMAYYILKERKKNAYMLKFDNELFKIPPTKEWTGDLELVHLWHCNILEIPEGMSPYCPKLSTLIINGVPIFHIPESFFESMNILTTLDLSYNEYLESLPNSITKLSSLVSLVLTGCASLKHVPPLGELQALSRLDLSNSSIAEAPQGLEKLINLKWLDLSLNDSLIMELGSLSNLTKMQYLDLRDTCAMISVEDVQGMIMLECFGGIFHSKDYHQYVGKIPYLSFELKTYNLIFRNVCGEARNKDWFCKKVTWGIYSNLKRFDESDPRIRTIQFGDCEYVSHILPEDLTYLHLHENTHWVCLCGALSYTPWSPSHTLSTIHIDTCQKLKSLFCSSESCSFCTNIDKLEHLELHSLESLIVVYNDVGDVRQSLSSSGIFSFLKEFKIFKCKLIKTLLTPPLVEQLQNLEKIFVWACDSMKEIFAVSNSDDDDSSSITLPKLTRLELGRLPQLKIVCKGSIRCRSSPILFIFACPSLERHPTIEIKE